MSNPTYSWCRTPANGGECTPLPGIYGASYTIAAVNAPDDGAQFRVTATGTQGTATSAFSTLYVSSLPAVVFEDGEFLEPDWIAAPTGSEGAPTFSMSRMVSGGNPGAFLNETYDIPATVGQTLIFHSKLSANYDPTSQGAIYLLEFSMQCKTATPLTWVTFGPMFEQAGRRFAAEDPARFGSGYYCVDDTWRTTAWGPMSSGFYKVSGPECGSGESCPDLSASAPPLRFGLLVIERSISPGAAQPITYRYDNWKVSVWRK